MTSAVEKKIVPQNQVWESRAGIMTQLMQKAFSAPISALEIGVWYGVGSTNIWLQNLPQKSKLLLVDSWKPYSSEDDLKDKDWDYKRYDDLSTDAFLSAFLNVKKFQYEQAKREISVHMTRGESAEFLNFLKEDHFDFIYIDGDHKYENAKRDIQQAKKLVNKKFGIICGDDLEKLPTPHLVELARNHKDMDFHRSEEFHPGVLLAVAEEFPKVNMINGFWWIVCHENAFNPEILKAT